MLYFDCILDNLLLDFNGKSLVNFKIKKSSLDKGTYMYLNHFDAKRKNSIDILSYTVIAKVSQHDKIIA